MRPHVPESLRRQVVERARGRCEYCLLSQARQEATFHVDVLQMNRPLILVIRAEEAALGRLPEG